MKLRMQVLGLKDLEISLRNIVGTVINPQGGISDILADALEDTVLAQAKRNVWRLFDTDGDFPERIVIRKVNQYRVDIEVRAPYGAVHEYGGTFEITARQRRFFWAMFVNTEDEMWKALALSVTYTIPARPYLRPAIDSHSWIAVQKASAELSRRMAKAAGPFK